MNDFDRFDLAPPVELLWPIARSSLIRVGQTVMADRNGAGRPHYGIDLFALPGSPILSASAGIVVRVRDGRSSTDINKRRAGLWVDVKSSTGLLFRYLHLDTTDLSDNMKTSRGGLIGFLGHNTHLHFEIRKSDTNNGRYGDAIDPLRLLPSLRA